MKILTDANLEQYTDEFYEVEPEDYRPVLIEPGNYPAELVDWSKEYSRQFRKLTLVMNFRIGADVIPSWFNIEPSDSETTVKAGWKSNFLRMYQECLNVRLDRLDRISMRQDVGGGGGKYHQRQRREPDVRGESLFQGKEDLRSEGRGYVLNTYI